MSKIHPFKSLRIVVYSFLPPSGTQVGCTYQISVINSPSPRISVWTPREPQAESGENPELDQD